VSGFQGRRVIDPVAGHGHNLARRLKCIHQNKLLLRHHARKDIDPFYPLLERPGIHLFQFFSGHDLVRIFKAYLPCYGCAVMG